MNIGLTGKRVKYAKQRDRFSCSPIAIINMMKWLGVPCSVDEYLPMFKEACKTKIKIGTRLTNFLLPDYNPTLYTASKI